MVQKGTETAAAQSGTRICERAKKEKKTKKVIGETERKLTQGPQKEKDHPKRDTVVRRKKKGKERCAESGEKLGGREILYVGGTPKKPNALGRKTKTVTGPWGWERTEKEIGKKTSE